MPDTIIESVLTGKLDANLLTKWLNNEPLEDALEDCILHCCNRNEFVTCFLSFLRNQTDSILQTNSNAVQILQHSTPEKLLSTRRKHHRSISDPTSADRTMDSLTVKTDNQRSHESPSRDRKRTGRRVKTKLFTEEKSNQSISSDESRISIDRLSVSASTPMKNGLKPSEYPSLPLTSPVTPRSFVKEHHERCDTPRLTHRHRAQEKNCLGDFMVNVQKSSKKKKDKRISSDNDDSKLDLDLSNSEVFPEIGARKSSSLRSEKRRIKPTNIDKSNKSLSLNSFSAESIHTSPLLLEENSVFRQQKIQVKASNSFDVERNILKQERHKLMEKFNILNTSLPQKPLISPTIKITHKLPNEKSQNFIKSDTAKVAFKEKLDLLVDIYEILLKNNLIMSVNTEIYFLISVLISKQYENDYLSAESKLKENNMGYLLKTIHNSTYFAIKSLWHQRMILEVILDKTALKTLGENKKVRSFYPDLAKFLLNCYGLRCEAESTQERSRPTEQQQQPNGVICFNFETDNVENFPSMLSFQNFKKQRDMFYEILRWYGDTRRSGGSVSSLRARAKALVSGGCAGANHAHLAALFVQHMLQHCLPPCTQESKLSKLQRRLTCPTGPESHRLPHFTANEMFYKEFIINAESDSFRSHFRDTLASEITALDAAQIAPDDRGNSNVDITKEYLLLSKKLSLLSKFLGFLTSLPYSQVVDLSANKGTVTKSIQRDMNYVPPKEKVHENDLALRNYSQPTIDLQGMLRTAIDTGRLSITIPWIVHYLSMLDYTSLRIKYYQNLLKNLFDIYTNRLKTTDTYFKKNTIIYLKSILGWLFDLPYFPHELFYENRLNNSVVTDMSIDSCDLVDESVLIELCPHLKDLNVLLSTCRVSSEQKEMGSYRHITPVSLTLNQEDRIKNKEKELQARLEEELLKSQPSSTRRVLELVIERVTSAVVRELSAKALVAARDSARELALQRARGHSGDQSVLLASIQQIYREHLQQLRTMALTSARANIQSRAESAVSSLLASAPAPLVTLVVKASLSRLGKWLNDNWNSTAVLCKDIESEMKTFIAMGPLATSSAHKSVCDVTAMTSPADVFDANNISPAACVINLKEHICLLLDDESPTDLPTLLSQCVMACAPTNIFARPHTTRGLLQLSVDLCVVYVSRKPSDVTPAYLSRLHGVWNTCCPERRRAPSQDLTAPDRRDISPDCRQLDCDDRAPTPISDDEGQVIQLQDLKITNKSPRSPNSLNHPLSPKSPHFFGPAPRSPITLTRRSRSRSPSLNQGPRSPNTLGQGPRSPNAVYQGPRSPNSIYPTPKSPSFHQSTPYSKFSKTIPNPEPEDNTLLEFFDRILCPRNIMLLGSSSPQGVWEAMADVLVFLLENDYLSEDSLTEQCLAVYRQDWPQNVLESLSTCMKSVSARWSRCSTGKFTLFLDFLAEYCGNMDYESMD